MKRITPDDVERAYARTGLVPSRGDDQWFSDDGEAGCAATALVKAAIPDFRNSVWPYERVAMTLDVTTIYLQGFIRGFDGGQPERFTATESRSLDHYTLGHADGKAAADRVFGSSRVDRGTT